MHKRGYCRHAVSVRPSVCLSVRPSVTFVDHVKTNKYIFEIFSPSRSHTSLVFPCQTGWRYSDGNPHNGGVECRWQKSRFWSNSWLSLVTSVRWQMTLCDPIDKWRPVVLRWISRRTVRSFFIEDCWTCEVPKTFTDDEAEYMTQSATHHWLLIDCWTCKLRSDKNSYWRPCSVDRTVRDAPANDCLWRPAAWTNTPNRREQKII